MKQGRHRWMETTECFLEIPARHFEKTHHTLEETLLVSRKMMGG
jgi:hypothetical protein